jgi:hypothetical protein
MSAPTLTDEQAAAIAIIIARALRRRRSVPADERDAA